MAAEGGQRYELGPLILDYLRTFMWPVIVIALATFQFEDLMEVVKGREVNIFGLEIGPAVARLQETTEQELADLQALVAELKADYRRELEAAGRSGAGAPTEATVSEQTREGAQAVETKLSGLRANPRSGSTGAARSGDPAGFAATGSAPAEPPSRCSPRPLGPRRAPRKPRYSSARASRPSSSAASTMPYARSKAPVRSGPGITTSPRSRITSRACAPTGPPSIPQTGLPSSAPC
jgi:hypothetical protein